MLEARTSRPVSDRSPQGTDGGSVVASRLVGAAQVAAGRENLMFK